MKVTTLALPLLVLSATANAEWGITGTVDNEIQRYKETKHDARLGAGVQYRGEKLNIDQSGISFNFTNAEKIAIEALLTSKHQGFRSKDAKLFKGMDRRKESIDIGARAIVKTPLVPVQVQVTRDVRASKGFEADLKVGGIEPHNTHWSGERQFVVTPVIGVRYQSKDVVDYYYGVKQKEATATRGAYKAKAATTPYIGLESQLDITKDVSINASAIYERRDDSIRNSSLTNDDKYDVMLNLGVTYWF